MNFSVPAAGIQNASASFNSAAIAISQAFAGAGGASPSASGDSVDLSSAVAALLFSKLNFEANVSLEVVQNSINQSTFSIVG
jgi:hypothetical protein